jgi:hypothetical protein
MRVTLPAVQAKIELDQDDLIKLLRCGSLGDGPDELAPIGNAIVKLNMKWRDLSEFRERVDDFISDIEEFIGISEAEWRNVEDTGSPLHNFLKLPSDENQIEERRQGGDVTARDIYPGL